jgi:hypothetical protein
MNTDTGSPHLDLADLIAEATGQALEDRARQRLASCENCRVEASRWNLVAQGSAAWRPPRRRGTSLPGRGMQDRVYWQARAARQAPGLVEVQGTVSDASSAGFTVLRERLVERRLPSRAAGTLPAARIRSVRDIIYEPNGPWLSALRHDYGPSGARRTQRQRLPDR